MKKNFKLVDLFGMMNLRFLKKMDRKRLSKWLWLTGLVVLVFVGTVYSRNYKQTKKIDGFNKTEVTIILTEEGFSPVEIEVLVGQSVRFVTTRDTFFWPASNLHPIHNIYPEFDPQRPIGANESWDFKFEKIGEWRYHDHLAPYYTGVIKVKDTSSGELKRVLRSQEEGKCQGTKDNPPEKCWQSLMKKSLQDGGLDGAFVLLSQLYQSEPLFAENCHNFVHAIGDEVYQEFIKKGDLLFKVTPATGWCGYGFYHGFMTRLFGSDKDTKIARDFCAYIDKQLAKDSPETGASCYHGIGHGAVVDPDKNLWGNAEGLIKQTIKMCKDLHTDTDDQLNNCYNGVFNGLGTLYTANQYGFMLDAIGSDPYLLCRKQPEELKNSCYLGMYITVLRIGGGDLIKVAQFVKTIPEDRYAQTAIRQLAANIAYKDIKNSDHSGFFLACRSLQERLQRFCFIGGVKALIEIAEPGNEYKQLSICKMNILTSDEREDCYLAGFEVFRKIYPREKVSQICLSIEKQYRKYCGI